MRTIQFFKDNYDFLSNFYPIIIEYEGFKYPSVEHAYQAQKSLSREVKKIFTSKDIPPGLAKRLGKLIETRDDWDQYKMIVMTELVHLKFNDPILSRKLVETGNAELIEGNWWGDTFWGIYDGKGMNHLGKILMAKRNIINSESKFYV